MVVIVVVDIRKFSVEKYGFIFNVLFNVFVGKVVEIIVWVYFFGLYLFLFLFCVVIDIKCVEFKILNKDVLEILVI